MVTFFSFPLSYPTKIGSYSSPATDPYIPTQLHSRVELRLYYSRQRIEYPRGLKHDTTEPRSRTGRDTMGKRSREALGETFPEGKSKKRKQDGKDGKERKKRLRELKKDVVGLPEQDDDVQMEEGDVAGEKEVLSKKAEKKMRKMEEARAKGEEKIEEKEEAGEKQEEGEGEGEASSKKAEKKKKKKKAKKEAKETSNGAAEGDAATQAEAPKEADGEEAQEGEEAEAEEAKKGKAPRFIVFVGTSLNPTSYTLNGPPRPYFMPQPFYSLAQAAGQNTANATKETSPTPPQQTP